MGLEFTTLQKEEIAQAVLELCQNSSFDSVAKFAKSVGLKGSDMTVLKKADWKTTPKLIGSAKWIKLAQLVGYQVNKNLLWHTAETRVKTFIDTQLNLCKEEQLWAMLVDEAGIGKTHACKHYARTHKYAFYLDCSVTPRKIAFVRKLATTVGLDHTGKIDDLIESIIYALSQMPNPVVILDEAGDLDHMTILLLKRLYNGLEGVCGFYLVGADGLKEKIERGVKWKKLGFQEFFSRVGRRFSRVLPTDIREKQEVMHQMAEALAIVNGIEAPQSLIQIKKSLVINRTIGDLRRARREIIKLKKSA